MSQHSTNTSSTPVIYVGLDFGTTDKLGELKASKRFIDTQDNLDELGLSVLDAVSLYLSRLWDRFKAQAKVELSGSSVDDFPIHLILTRPANWPKDAVARLQEAVKNAGICRNVETLAEAEAAGVALLMDQVKRMEINVQDNFIICDCGGGTIDSIGYQVSNSSPLELSECVPGECILGGAVVLDDAFKDMFLSKLEAMCPAPTFKAIKPRDMDDLILRYWDYDAKRHYRGSGYDLTINLPIEFVGAKGRRARLTDETNTRMVITDDELASIFDPVVEKIVSLIQAQIGAVMAATGQKPKAVVVAGGFGRNKYVQSVVKARIEEGSAGAIRVISYNDTTGWAAVAVGGVAHARLMNPGQSPGQNPPSMAIVQSRLSRQKYGFRWANQGLQWIVEPGTSLPARAPNKYAVNPQAFGVMNTRGSTYLTLDLCAGSGMGSVQRICQLQWFAEAGSPGRACFELGLTYDGTDPSFTVFLDGHLQGSGEVKFVFD
ncbi:hypothetical protein EDB80DRAFT_842256 [Ilyonectria destructans]|nr:hypothetical protein EDB80DRAFT_842256 [Ilyonectria destructans]